MFELRTKNLIINNASGNVVVDSGVIALKGFDSITSSKISEVKMARSQAPAVQVNSTAITAPAVAGEAIFYIKAKNSRQTAQYAWDKIEFGKRFPVSVSVLATDDEAALKVKLATAINNQNAKYGDLPFTANGTTAVLTGKAGSESISWAADGAIITKDDGTVVDVVWSTTVTTANNVGIGLGKQLEENVSMLLPSNGAVSAEKSDEKPIIGSVYSELSFKVAFTSDSVAAPGFVGETSQSGTYDVCLYVNETELGDTEIGELLAELHPGCVDGDVLIADGSDVYNAVEATQTAAFIA